MPFIIPTGVDRGDGISLLPAQPEGSSGTGTFGTPDGNGSVTIVGPGGNLVTIHPDGTSDQPPQETPDSPEIERAEQATIMHKMVCGYWDGIALLQGLARGTFLEDSVGNITRVLSSKLSSRPGLQSELVVVAESISFDSPPDEFSCTPIDLGIDIIKHPRYAWAIAPTLTDTGTYTTVGDTKVTFVNIKSALIRMLQTYREAPFFPSPDQVNGLIQSNILQQLTKGADGHTSINIQMPNPDYDSSNPVIGPPVAWDGKTSSLPQISGNPQYLILNVPVNLSSAFDTVAIAVAAAKEIISKLWRQEDVPYIPGFQVTLAQYFFKPVFLNPGSYSESPIGIVPDYFMSPSQDGTDTIFDQMAAINPQCFSDDGTALGNVKFSSLRKSDEVDFQRSWFRYPSTWILSPIGTFDPDIYSGGERPQNATQFSQLI